MPLSPTPTKTPSVSLTEIPRAALLEQLEVTLRRFEHLSVALPTLKNENALWFHPHEAPSVNQVWEEHGIDGVLAKWGATRTFASGSPVSLARKPSELSPEAPENATVLLVCEYGPSAVPNPAQLNYFRSCAFELSEVVKSEILQTLTQAGLLTTLIPTVDTATNVALRGSPITDVRCSSDWYGPENMYGDGSVFILSLRISPPDQEAEVVDLTLEKDGSLQRRLWCASFVETGYEGHDRASLTLTTDELRALISIAARVAEVPTQKAPTDRIGFWHGALLTPIPESVAS